MSSIATRFVVALAVALLAAAALFAATQNAVVYGTVYDSTGSPLVGASVTMENAAIGFSRTTTTGVDGEYNFAEVPPAEDYRLSAVREGKKIDVRSGIVVNVGDERVILPPLKEQPVTATPGGEVKEQRIEAQAVANETVSTTISGVITGEQLRSLPVAVNRNFLNLGLIPSNTHDVEQGSALAGASFSVAGNRPATNNFLLDGADNVASSSNQAVPFQVNDAVQEFRVLSATANAEYGRNMGGTVNIVTRRGGNAFHGSAFGYFNSDQFNATSPLSVYNGSTFDKAAAYAGNPASTFIGFSPLTYNDFVSSAQARGFCTDSNSVAPGAGLTPCPSTGLFGRNTRFNPAALLSGNDQREVPFESKQFGANIGGPLAKDKWFMFGSYEGTLIDNPTPIFERVPTDFDRTYAPFGTALFGFASTDPNYVLGQNIIGLFPQSNVVGVPGVLEFFRGEAPNYTDVHNYLVRSDFIHSEKTTLSMRYAIQFLDQLHDSTLPEQGNYPGNGAMRDALNQNLNLAWSHNINTAWITEFRAGYNRFKVTETPQDAEFNPASIGLPLSGMPTVMLNGFDSQSSGSGPTINGAFASWSDFFTFGTGLEVFPTLDYLFPFARLGAPLGAPLRRRDTTAFLANNTSWSRGRHGIKFGFDFRRLNNHLSDASFSRGFMYSSNIGEFTSDSNTCNAACLATRGDFNAFLRPSFDFFQQQSQFYESQLTSFALAGYIQDTWRLNPRWTLNMGLRYEYFSVPQDSNGQLWNFDPLSNGLVQQNGFNVVDPYGVACGAPGTYRSVPRGRVSAFSAGPWACENTASGFQEIAEIDRNNFAPRFGVAWDALGNGKTVVRAGTGFFFDQLPASYISQLMYNRPTTSPNALFGVLLDGRVAGFCPVSFVSCGVGNSIIDPAVQAASFDGINPNSFYSQATQPFAIYGRDTQNSKTPYSQQVSASVQQQISSKVSAELGYIGGWGRNLPAVFNSNLSNEVNLENVTGGNIAFFPIFSMTNQADSSYNSLMARVRVAEWHGLRLNTTYVWAKSLDNQSAAVYPVLPLTMPNLAIGYQVLGQQNPNAFCIFFGLFCTLGGQQVPLTLPTINFSSGAVTTTGAGQILTSRYLLPQDPFNFLENDRGRSDFDTKHRMVLDYTWDVPSLEKAWGAPRWLDYWMLSGVLTVQSGQPFSIFAGPVAGEITQRANIVGQVDVSDDPSGAISTSGLQLATSAPFCANRPAFVPGSTFLPTLFQPERGVPCTGNSGRNSFTGPRYTNMNVAVQKGFPMFGEGRMLTFRTEFFNVFNHANFYNPISQLSLDGVTVNPDFGKIKSAHEARQIQFAARFTW